jgi:branched-chain amino acid transport system substrate-binding protein
MKRPTVRSWASGIVLIALAFVGCARVFRPSRAVRADVVGVVVPLSGPYKLIGENLLAGIRAGWQRSDLQLVVRDSRGEPEAAAAAVEELAMREGAIAILGGVVGEEAQAAAKRADELGVVLMSFSKDEDITRHGPYVFRNMVTIKSQAEAMARFASCQLGVRKFAVLSPDAGYGGELTDGFEEGVEHGGGEIVRREEYAPDQTTFRTEAQKLSGRFEPEKRPDYLQKQKEISDAEPNLTKRRKAIEKLRSSLPPIVDYQALFLPDGWKTVSLIAPALAFEDVITNACDATDLERIRKTMGRSDLTTVTLLGWSGWASPINAEGLPELLARGGKFLHCAVYADGFFAQSTRSSTKQFVSRFQELNQKPPDILAAHGYDSARMVRQFLEKDPVADSNALRDRLTALRDFDGATGVTSFDDHRAARKPPFFLRIEPSGIREMNAQGPCKAATSARRAKSPLQASARSRQPGP